MTDIGRRGSDILCSTLVRLGADCIFGLPGTQNVALYEALRCSSLRAILATHELAAAFMANGYYRASGRVGVFTTIPGPGFAYSLAGLAEAFLDSAAVVHIVEKPAALPGRKFNLQAIDQTAMASPVVKRVYQVEDMSELSRTIEQAYATATADEPGPVLVQVADSLLTEVMTREHVMRSRERPQPESRFPAAAPELVAEALRLLAASRRAVIYAGQGTLGAARQLRELAELLQAPVVATRSARGVLAEDHPLSLVFDFGETAVGALNSLLDHSDLILALGCKFTHNGTAAFRLQFAQDKLIHVDASPEVLGANYPAQLSICADVSSFLDSIVQHRDTLKSRSSAWSSGQLASWSSLGRGGSTGEALEPKVHGVEPPTPAGFFAALRRAMPAEGCLVTDSGLHQVLATRHFKVLSPRGLVVPTDFQSMGFGLPAAIGAKLAAPARAVVALIGDGGLAMTGMELLTAVREKIPLVVIVFNDGALGQIRLQQVSAYGHSHATELRNPDFALLAESVGARYLRLQADAEAVLRRAISSAGVTLVEVVLGDSPAIHAQRARSLARETLRGLLSPRIVGWLKRRWGTSRS